MRWIITSILVFLIPLVVYAAQPNWQSVCPNADIPYCKNIGENAHNNATNPPAIRGIKLGKIIGVSWRPKGSVIGISEAIPSAGISESVRISPRNAYYYIIDDGSGKLFLRQCREIDAK